MAKPDLGRGMFLAHLSEKKFMRNYSDAQVARRKFPRRRFQSQVGCLYRGHYFIAQGLEIGEGGLALATTENLELSIGDLFALSFQVPDGRFACLQAEVRNISKAANGETVVGCLFRNLKFEYKRDIRVFVTARSTFEH